MTKEEMCDIVSELQNTIKDMPALDVLKFLLEQITLELDLNKRPVNLWFENCQLKQAVLMDLLHEVVLSQDDINNLHAVEYRFDVVYKLARVMVLSNPDNKIIRLQDNMFGEDCPVLTAPWKKVA